MAASASILPWLWVVEALASFKQVDASILIDLVKRTPEISDDLGKNAREKVSLRILESFVAQKIGSRKGVSSAPDSKIEFDPSEHCEDVVRNILHEISASNLRTDEPEIWKWDVQTFITHKSASLSKCTLQQLKDAILEGNHPILASLRERSGLSISKQSENRISVDNGDLNAVSGKFEGSCSYGQTMEAGGNITSPTPENLDGFLQGDTLDNDSLLSKRNRVDLVMENQVSRSHEDRNSTDNGFVSHLHNVKKLKKDATSTSQPVGQESVLIIGNELSEDLFGRNGQHTDLAKLSQMGGLEESRFLEHSHDQHIASKIHVQGNDADDTELQHNHSLISCNNNTVPQDTSRDGPVRDYPIIDVMDDEHCAEMGTPNVPQDTSGDGPQRDPPIIEAKDDEHCAEMRKPNVAPLVGTHQNICGDEARDKYEKSLLNTSNGAPLEGSYQNNFPNEAKDDVDHNPGQEMSSDSDGYQDEKTDVALKKRTFLSSQCTFSQDSLTTADYTELNLCMKCNKGGQLLGCSASACPLVVHQTCLGSAPSFDDNGKFYCPFCAYSQAISVYLEVKKKASLSRKDLAAFVGLENEHRANKLSKRFHRPEQDQLIQDEDNLNGNNRVNYNGSYANEVISSQYKENIGDKQQVEPSVSCVKGNLPCQEGGTTIDDGAPHLLTEHNRKDLEGGEIGPGSQSASVLKGQQIEEQSVSNLDHNSSCRDTEIVHATKIRGEDIMQKEVLQPLISDSTQKTPCPQNIDAGESSEEENDKPTPNYSRPLRRREKQYTYPAIPQLRRKKVPWTSVEEEILKEGVRRFSSVHDRNIPWKRILEFGSHVFEKGRTTIDLKDKWRNICKGSPKPK